MASNKFLMYICIHICTQNLSVCVYIYMCVCIYTPTCIHIHTTSIQSTEVFLEFEEHYQCSN